MKRIEGYDPNDSTAGRTTEWDYYDRPPILGDPPVYAPNSPDELIHGRLKSVRYPDGRWEYYTYQDSPAAQFSWQIKASAWGNVPFNDQDNAKKEVMTFRENEVTTVTSIAGVLTGKSAETRAFGAGGIVTLTRKDYDSAGAEFTTITAYHPTDFGGSDPVNLFKAGRIKYELHPDGTATRYEYSADNSVGGSGELTETEETGAGNENAITDGIRTVRTYTKCQVLIGETVTDIASGLQISSWTGSNLDFKGRPTRIEYNGDPNDYEEKIFSCCGLSSYRKRDGTIVSYDRDALKRVTRVETDIDPNGSTPVLIDKTDHTGLSTRRTREAGGTTLLVGESTRLLNGRTSQTISPDADGVNPSAGEATTYAYQNATASSGEIVTMTYPDGSTSITESYLDGRPQKVSGTAVSAMAYAYSVDTTSAATYKPLVTKVTRLASDSATTGTEWSESHTDALGRTFKQVLPNPTPGGTSPVEATRTYHGPGAAPGSRGKLQSSTDFNGVTTTYSYNAEGETTITNRPMPNSSGNLTIYNEEDVHDHSGDVGIAYRSKGRINGFNGQTQRFRSTDGFASASYAPPASPQGLNTIRVTDRGATLGDGARTITTTRSDGPYSVQTYSGNRLQSVVTYDGDDNPLTSQTYAYDGFGRVTSITDARTGATSYNGYLENGAVTSITDAAGHTTAYSYDEMGRVTEVDAPDTLDSSGAPLLNKTYTSYTERGQVQATWGDQTYARFYVYDEQGRMTQLRTYQDDSSFTAASGPSVSTPGYALTSWVYDSQRGWLTDKKYPDVTNASQAGVGPRYTYHPSGQLKTREWVRTLPGTATRVTTTYSYDLGYLDTVSYNDAITPDLDYTYDSFGRISSVAQGGVTTHSYSYDNSSLTLDSETIAYDVNGDGDTTDTEDLVRTLDRSQDIYLRNTGWELRNGSSVEHYTTYGYDSAARLETVTAPVDPIVGCPHNFEYNYLANSGNLIESLQNCYFTATNTWEASRNVLTDIVTRRSDNQIVSQHGYVVNAIGQRTQHTHVTHADQNGPMTYTIGYNTRGEVVEANSDRSASQYDRSYAYDGIGNRQNVTTDGGTPVNYTANALNQYSAIGPHSRQHDLDGNLIAGIMPTTAGHPGTLEWDGENRLIKVSQTSGVVVEYRYDYLGRKIHKETTTGASTSKVYDGWNLIMEYTHKPGGPTESVSYVWGLDLSGSLQGAGGVGGLLAVSSKDPDVVVRNFYPAYDGNGNITEYISKSAGGQVSPALFLSYDPYGNITDESGWLGNPTHRHISKFRFSTKERDHQTGLYYYGYRHYDPNTGRWPSRDPIEERGGMNLYGFVSNDVINEFDFLGLYDWDSQDKAMHEAGLASRKASLDELKKRQGAYDALKPSARVGVPRPIKAYEFGARVCRTCIKGDDGSVTYKFYFTGPVTDCKVDRVDPTSPPSCKDKDVQVGFAHSHPVATQSTGVGLGLSPEDIRIADRGKNRSIRRNGGRILPPNVASPAGISICATFKNAKGDVVSDIYSPRRRGDKKRQENFKFDDE